MRKREKKGGGERYVFIPYFLQQPMVGCLDSPLLSSLFPCLDMGVSSSFCPKVGQNFYIAIVEIWCIDSKKKREERVLLMISSVEIIILLFSSSSLRVS